MVHIIFPVTWAALRHYYLPVLPTVEWNYFPSTTTITSPSLSKVSYQSGGRNSYSSISSLNDWLSPVSSPFSLYSRVLCSYLENTAVEENGQAHRHQNPHWLVSSLTVGATIAIMFKCPCLLRSNSNYLIFSVKTRADVSERCL